MAVTIEHNENEYVLNVTEDISFSDMLIKDSEAVFYEALRLVDKCHTKTKFRRDMIENIKVREKLRKDFERTFIEPFVIFEGLPILGELVLGYDNPNAVIKEIGKVVKERFTIAEEYWDYISFNLHILEHVNVTDSGSGREVVKALSDSFAIVESGRNYDVGKMVKENLNVIDSFDRKTDTHRLFREFFGVDDRLCKHPALNKFEAFGIVGEELTRINELNIKESFVVSDEFDRVTDTYRLFNETIDFYELPQKHTEIFKTESFAMFDAFIKPFGGILSNVTIFDTELTLEGFNKWVNLPPTFDKFIEFKVGEYEYQEALVKIVTETNVRQAQPSIAGIIHHVDIPDTDDRGVVTITDTKEPTKVYFNKFYYHPPEVVAVIKGGNTGDGVLIPNVVTTEGKDSKGRYFEIELRDESWLKRKTGTVSWTAKGY